MTTVANVVSCNGKLKTGGYTGNLHQGGSIQQGRIWKRGLKNERERMSLSKGLSMPRKLIKSQKKIKAEG